MTERISTHDVKHPWICVARCWHSLSRLLRFYSQSWRSPRCWAGLNLIITEARSRHASLRKVFRVKVLENKPCKPKMRWLLQFHNAVSSRYVFSLNSEKHLQDPRPFPVSANDGRLTACFCPIDLLSRGANRAIDSVPSAQNSRWLNAHEEDRKCLDKPVDLTHLIRDCAKCECAKLWSKRKDWIYVSCFYPL